MVKPKKPPAFHYLVITSFRLYMLIAALLSTIAGMMALYSAGPSGVGCRRGLEIAATVLQGAGLLSTIIALLIVGSIKYLKRKENPQKEDETKGFLVALTAEKPTHTEMFNGSVQLLAGIGGFIMILFIVLRNDCGNPSYNAVYSIFSIGGAFLATLITSFVSKTNKTHRNSNRSQYPTSDPRIPFPIINRNVQQFGPVRYGPNVPSWAWVRV